MKKIRLPGGDLEFAVLVKLWELGIASAREIHEQVGQRSGLAYTTTAKVLDRLKDKGLVSRERQGKAFFYRPRVEAKVVEHERARSMLSRLLGGRQHSAVAALVGAAESLDPRLLDELERAVAARRRSRDGA